MSDQRSKDEARRDEALRSLDRVEAESETVAGSTFVRMAKRAQDHFGAHDLDEDDKVEVWGTRIGRGAGLIFAVGLLVYLAITYL
ncbi:hypothetical protein [Labrenzia sp. CE80]|uniref:hypothetical protein n=1 Tax=Labrenzia sp. CE80 TaxID=1788986 RepID=UPI00129BA2CA|nr:hypothetical protein [Labrenzia sp. CE80]